MVVSKFDAAKLDTFFNVHNTFFVFNGTFIEEPFSYTCYCVFFFCVVITPQNEVFNNFRMKNIKEILLL